MKKLLNYILVLCFIVLSVACEKKAEDPEILLFEAVPSTLVAGQAVTFRIRVEGDYISLWPGIEASNYHAYLEQINNPEQDTTEATNRFYDKGISLAITDTNYVYSLYTDPGLYEAILIVTNSGKLGEELKRTQASIQVEVTEAP